MRTFLTALAHRLWPDFDKLPIRQQDRLLAELAVIAYALPLTLLTTAWLIRATDWQRAVQLWPLLLLLLGLGMVISRLFFYEFMGEEAGSYSYNTSDLQSVVAVSAILLLGPIAIWLFSLNRLISFFSDWSERTSRYLRWNWLRNLLENLWTAHFQFLVGLWVYQELGGSIPLPGLNPVVLLAALAFILVGVVVDINALLLMLRVQFSIRDVPQRMQVARTRQLIRFFIVSSIPAFFGILAAALYSELGLGAYLFFFVGVILVGALAQRLSRAAVLSQQRARQLGQLEQLGRALINAPVGDAQLSALLAEHLPQMLDYARLEVQVFEKGVSQQLPAEAPPVTPAAWAWLRERPQTTAIFRGERFPWSQEPADGAMLLVPILDVEDGRMIGGIILVSSDRYTEVGLRETLPSLRVLAEQLASTLHRVETYEQRLAYERVTQELAFARQIQSSFLPEQLPEREGWQISAALLSARQTSGDFYDVFTLPDGRLVLIVADVADKGMGAALFMAVSRTLLRTAAFTHPDDPAQALALVNTRILNDTSNDMFVTLFYGLLDPVDGRLLYANAGHNPPLLLDKEAICRLGLTGMPLGILENSTWKTACATMMPGDLLFVYTDGITEAHNSENALFGEERLEAVLRAGRKQGVTEVSAAVLEAVEQFSGEMARYDDVTLLVLKRE